MSDLITFLGGGFVGAVITSIVNIFLEWKRVDNETKALIKALKTEIFDLEYIFINEFFKKLTPDEEPYWYSYPLTTDYFIIYKANCSKIGKIKNDELRKTIISIYSTANFFLDCLRTNNDCIEYYEKMIDKYGNNTENEYVKGALESLIYSKVKNILPTAEKLKCLLDRLKTL